MSNLEWAVAVRGHGAYLDAHISDAGGNLTEIIKGSPEYDDGDFVIEVANVDAAKALSEAIALVRQYDVPMWFYSAWPLSREVERTKWSSQESQGSDTP